MTTPMLQAELNRLAQISLEIPGTPNQYQINEAIIRELNLINVDVNDQQRINSDFFWLSNLNDKLLPVERVRLKVRRRKKVLLP